MTVPDDDDWISFKYFFEGELASERISETLVLSNSSLKS